MEHLSIYKYPRPMVTVDAVVIAGDSEKSRILLIQRGREPFAGAWALPGGFVEMDESLEEAVARELEEETGVCNIPLAQFHTFGDPGRDPRGRSISVAYLGRLPEPAPLHAGDDAAHAAWFPVHELPILAFDHAMIVETALKNLFEERNAAANTGV